MILQLQPVDFREAQAFLRRHHRHHLPPQGWKFGVAVAQGDALVGVVTCGRPVARHLDDGFTIEATRCCTDGTKNVASMLYGAAWRAARAMGYRRLVTYTLACEPGTSLRAAGYRVVHATRPQTWHRGARPRVDKHPTGQKWLWEVLA